MQKKYNYFTFIYSNIMALKFLKVELRASALICKLEIFQKKKE